MFNTIMTVRLNCVEHKVDVDDKNADIDSDDNDD